MSNKKIVICGAHCGISRSAAQMMAEKISYTYPIDRTLDKRPSYPQDVGKNSHFKLNSKSKHQLRK